MTNDQQQAINGTVFYLGALMHCYRDPRKFNAVLEELKHHVCQAIERTKPSPVILDPEDETNDEDLVSPLE